MSKILMILTLGFSLQVQGQDSFEAKPLKWTIELEGSYHYFPETGLYPKQDIHYPSFAITPEFSKLWKKGKQKRIIRIKAFARYDIVDEERTHWDVREAYYHMVFKKWELSFGAKNVYWGVTESKHLVDFLNQSDFLEGFGSDSKLGQPMVQVSLPRKWGTLDLFVLTYPRGLDFPGQAGRQRPGDAFEPIDEFILDFFEQDPLYESELEEWHPDVAVRWSHYLGRFDVALSQFYGTSRIPIVTFDPVTGLPKDVFYEMISRSGLELQVSTGPILWKLESIFRYSERKNIFASVAGFEYTLSNFAGTGADVGLIGEYLYDDRGLNESFDGLDKDVFVGSRIAFNDRQSTDILGGVIADVENGTRIYQVEANRRIGNSWKLSLEYQTFSNVSPKEFLHSLRKDGFAQINLIKYFTSKDG